MQGLSNLKEKSDFKPDSTLIPPNHEARVHLAELEGEIAVLKNQKIALQVDVENLNYTYSSQKKIELENIKKLKARRSALLKMVKDLYPKVVKLKSEFQGFSSGYEKFGGERFGDLLKIARQVAKTADLKEGELSEEEVVLSVRQEFLEGFAEYYQELAEISEAETSLNERRAADLTGRDMVVRAQADSVNSIKEALLSSKEKTSKAEKTALQKERIATKKLKEASALFDKAVGQFRDKERNIRLGFKKLEAKENQLDNLKKTLDNRERWLRDREGLLRRSAKELKKSA